MAELFELDAEIRNIFGKSAARRLRRVEEKIPAIMYGGDAPPQALTLIHKKVSKALESKAFSSHILTIYIDGKKEKAVLREVQRHPYKPKILHMDFQRISEKEKLTMTVPLRTVGEAPGIRVSGGILSHLLTTVEIACLPKDLPEHIEVDISDLEVDQSLHLSDLKLPEGVELVELSHGHDLPIVSIHLPRVKEEGAKVGEGVVPPSEKGEGTAPEESGSSKSS
jgi:large subunit ribosomal protein L25